MPIIKSAIKRVKQSEKRYARNTQTKKSLKDTTKALDIAIDSKNTKKMNTLLAEAYGAYDVAVKKNLMHKNKAARKKSHYSALVKEASSKKTSTAKPASKKTSAKKSSK